MRYLSILTFLFSIAVINPAHAGILVELDLSVTNQLTLTATTETAMAKRNGFTGKGIVLQGTGQCDRIPLVVRPIRLVLSLRGRLTRSPKLLQQTFWRLLA